MLVTQPLGPYGRGESCNWGFLIHEAHGLLSALWSTGIFMCCPTLMELQRRKSLWTKKTFLCRITLIPLPFIKELFLCVLPGNLPLWSRISLWIRPLHSPEKCTAYSLQLYNMWKDIGCSGCLQWWSMIDPILWMRHADSGRLTGLCAVLPKAHKHAGLPTCVASVRMCQGGQTEGQQ